MIPENLGDLRERTLKNFLDLLILAQLNNGHTISGYDVVTTIHSDFHIRISPGTVYSMIYALERDGLIEGRWNRKKRVYRLTNKGKETIKTTHKLYDKIQILVTQLFGT